LPTMKVLVAEYASWAAGYAVHLQKEGQAMLDVLKVSFTRSGHRVLVPPDFGRELEALARRCDAGVIVAPDEILACLTQKLETGCENLGSPAPAVELAADKLGCSRLLRSAGIATPGDAPSSGRWVLKPRYGCGCEGVRMVPSKNVADCEVIEPYVEGEHLSVCMVASPSGVLPLSLNSQNIEVGGVFRYRGNEVNINHPRRDECLDTARRAVEVVGLRGACGVDIVLADVPYVVDVNPRMTTSFVGVSSLLPVELAELILRAHEDELPARVELSGSARFDIERMAGMGVRL